MEINELQLIAAQPLRELLGGVSDMTIFRWMDRRDFPQPIVAGDQGRRFWRLKDVAAWQENHLRQANTQTLERGSSKSEAAQST
jgi:predicted DNA-binding transcriptional regulator AlpA